MAISPTMPRAENGLLKQDAKLAATALSLLERRLILPGLFDRHAEGEFRGALGDTINVKRPSKLKAKRRALRATGTFERSVLNEWSIPVRLADNVYSAINLPDEMLTLDVESFATQVIDPQIRAIAEDYEDMVATKMEASFGDGGTLDLSKVTDDEAKAALIRRHLTSLRKALNAENVPTAGRYAVLGGEIERILLTDPHLTKVDESGSASALREAVIGRLYGFTLLSSNAVPENAFYSFHGSALQLVSMAPANPQGATYSTSLSANGVALRYIRDYDFEQATDRSLINVYTGIGEVKDIPAKEDVSGITDPAVLLSKATQVRGLKTTVKLTASATR
ncbi:hypothetical protein GCM10012275_07990 [Longimycelium tulufanense]|uniref:Uncharacterized protein n=1 Tax=Longimycelium tulufanense TaxID=907463 RepID=A0A8J3C6G7_9PSEU|nr:P22 phage major capsid protein family protein [Longimycelium tulufanense]GGM39515.1 hypothetical protein GCM10012275_07990 [Longimycelium tulufanense]